MGVEEDRGDILAPAVTEESLAENVHIYPNFTSGFVQIALNFASPQNVQISVHSLFNVPVYEGSLENVSQTTHQLDLSGHREGMYFIHIVSERGQYRQRIWIKR